MEETFGSKLQKLRIQKGVSQQRLAKLSSYTQVYISLVENEKVEATKRCQTALIKALESIKGIDNK